MSSHQMEQQSRKSVDSSPSASAHQPTVAESQISASHMSRERSTHTDYDDTNSSYMLSNRNNQSDASSQRKDSDDVGRINLGGRHFLSRWFFWPVFSLFNYSRKYNLTLGVLGLPADESATRVAKQLDPHFKREFTKENKEKGSVARALRRAFSKNYNRLFVWRIFAIAFTYLGAYYLLMNVLGFIEELEDKDTRENYINTHLYALALLFSICLASMCTHQLTAASTCVGIQVRSAIMVMIYRKALRLHSVELAIGDIVNLLADDVNRLAEAYVHKHYLLSSVLEGLVVLALAFVELKLSALPAVAILALLFPIQYKLGQYISHNAFAMAKRTADRVSAISEILTTLRVIKCYAWEIFFRDQVKGIRVEELGHLRRAMMAKGWTYAVTLIAPLLLTIVCLAVEQKVTGEVNMRTTHIFALLSIFNMFRIPLIMLPLAVHSHESKL
jgi:ABC-type multidrug transport system fused ATPase/permease subunit